MKLEAGKYYRTRDGRKAFVAAVREDVDSEWKVYGWLDREECMRRWRECGRYVTCKPHMNLIEEWREPVSKTVTLYMHRDGIITMDKLFSDQAIARKAVTIVEGEGME